MFNRNRTGLIALIFSAFILSACGGSAVESGSNQLLTCDAPNVPDAAGQACVAPPPIECAAPTVPNEANDACVIGADPTLPDPVAFAGENQAVLYYNRASLGADNSPNDPSYDGYKLHTWNNDSCDAYADSDTDWANGRTHNGVDPNYGAYWILDLNPGYAGTAGACHNFIIHIGTDDAGKELGGGDFKGPLSQDDPVFARMNFTLAGEPTVFEYPLLSLGEQPVKIEGMAAHWLDVNTLLWNIDESKVDLVKLHYSASADLKATLEEGLNGTVVALERVDLSDEQKAIAPHLSGMVAFQGDWSADDAKAVLKTQAVLGGYNADDKLVAATGIQLANGIDQLYTTGEDDANEAPLGAVYNDDGIMAALWAPTASKVRLLSYNADKTLANAFDMTLDTTSGVWRYQAGMSMDRTLYRYEVTVFHPITNKIETLLVTDPYSVSLSTNGRFSRFVNLNDDDLKPAGWDSQHIPTIVNPEDAVIYEGHIRDFSVRDESTSAANRGKYLAFTEDGSAPVEHLRTLVENGLTHFHMLPANDIATIDEDISKTVDFSSTVGDLCMLNRDAAVCKEESASTKLGDVFASYSAVEEPSKAQALVEQMRGYDQFNWGYDPHHFNAPEGSYASDPEGVERIIEMRAMNQALHEMGLRVVLDVVYNHTNASGVFSKSVLDKTVPGYYHRYEVDSGAIVRETCCDDTEPRNVMMEKFMHDSLVQWAVQYKFDAFRFDIMSQASKATMLRLRDAVQVVDEDNYFYGEGWTKADRGYEQASQANMAGTEIGTFNDRIREAIRQGQFFAKEQSDGALSAQDRIKMGMAGTLSDYVLKGFSGVASTTSSLGGYATDPADIINYVSKHDNETLWDQFNYVLPTDMTLSQRVRAQSIGINLPLMSQGIPFLQMGGDMLRSKSMDRNTYDAGDWFNYVDFTKNSNNWNVGLPLAQDNESRWDELATLVYSPERAASMTEIEFASAVFNEFLSIRSTSPLFRLTTGQDIIDRVGFHNIGKNQIQGLIAMSIDDGVTQGSELVLADVDVNYDAVMVLVNGGYEEQSLSVNTASGFVLHATHANSIDSVVRGAYFTEGGDGNGSFTVPAQTMAVFVKPQSGAQGYGLSAIATAGAPDVVPYGSTTIYVRGAMNGWSTDNPMTYVGEGVYEATITISAGDYEFKVASSDWIDVDFGASAGQDITLGLGNDLAPSGANLKLSLADDATYKFSLDASDPAAPVMTVDYEEPFYGTTVYVRGAMNGWSEDDPMTYRVGGQYLTTLNLAAGSYEFKIASADWSTVDYGSGEASTTVTLGETKPLGVSGANLQIDIAEDGQYTLLFDASNLAEPTIGVFNAQMFGATTVYVRGAMNGWGESDPMVLVDGLYVADLAIDAGSYEFKIASADWSTVDFGALGDNQDVSLGDAKALGRSGANLKLDIVTSGTYRFTLEGPDPSAPKVTVSELP